MSPDGFLGKDEAAVGLASTDDLVRFNDEAARHDWGARWSRAVLEELADPADAHVVVPFLRNAIQPDEPQSCRCYVWLKLRGENARALSTLDVSVENLAGLRQPSERGLAYLVVVLLGGMELEKLEDRLQA